jgi:hypothetical protein
MAHDIAKNKAKKAFGGRCIFTGKWGVDGMHFLPVRGFEEYQDEDLNIFPGVRDCHNTGRPCFDWRKDGTPRPPEERLWMLRHMLVDDDDIRILVARRLRLLKEKIGDAFPVEEVPIDESFLRRANSQGWKSDMESGRAQEVERVQAEL